MQVSDIRWFFGQDCRDPVFDGRSVARRADIGAAASTAAAGRPLVVSGEA
jgi:hypothetical protein